MPDDHVGDEATWQRAEKALADACHEAGLEYEIQPKEGAFYGPKLEFKLYDTLGREWQCGTIQVDYQLPSAERLDATYIGADNQKHHPVMLHRAVLGSFERFLGILIENYAGNFPAWLAFEQVAVVPISNSFDDYARKVNDALLAADIRSAAYTSEENMKAKIKMITKEHKTPYILVVGEREQAEGTVAVRFRQSSGLQQQTMKIEDFVKYVQEKVETHFNGI
jgi:threonyl-tRNA synthetase